MRALTWILRAAVFFTLFAFALNNQHDAAVHWFFGHEWRAQMVFIVLAAFGLGCAFGISAMLPSWWRYRRRAQKLAPQEAAASLIEDEPPAAGILPTEHPPRDGV